MRPYRLNRRQLEDANKQLAEACFMAKKREHRRRITLERMAHKRLRRQPEVAYYMTLGTVPDSMSIYEYA